MKKFLVLLSLILAVAVNAQINTTVVSTNPPAPPTIAEIPSRILEFLSATSTNWLISSYGIYSSDIDGFGVGLAAGYSITPNVVTILRVDYLDGQIWMPSGSVQLQAPVRLMDRFTITPFIFAGIATPLSGRGDDNRTAAGIAGSGLATRFNEHLGVVYDVEMWSNFSGPQHRFGVYWKF